MQRVISGILLIISAFYVSTVKAQGPFGSSFGGSDLLPVEQAFTVSHPKADVIEISIADGTYLYDERTIVQNDAGAILATSRSVTEIYDDCNTLFLVLFFLSFFTPAKRIYIEFLFIKFKLFFHLSKSNLFFFNMFFYQLFYLSISLC